MLQFVKFSPSHLVFSWWFYTWNRIIGRGDARDERYRRQMELRHRWTWKDSSLLQFSCLHTSSAFEHPIFHRNSKIQFFFCIQTSLSPHSPSSARRAIYILIKLQNWMQKALTKRLLHPHEVPHPASPSIGDKIPAVHSSRGLWQTWRNFSPDLCDHQVYKIYNRPLFPSISCDECA